MLYFTSIGFLAQDSNGHTQHQSLLSHIILCTMQFVEQILLLPTTDNVTCIVLDNTKSTQQNHFSTQWLAFNTLSSQHFPGCHPKVQLRWAQASSINTAMPVQFLAVPPDPTQSMSSRRHSSQPITWLTLASKTVQDWKKYTNYIELKKQTVQNTAKQNYHGLVFSHDTWPGYDTIRYDRGD